MKALLKLILLLPVFGMVSACSDPIPEFSNSDLVDIPQPTFNGKTQATIKVGSAFVQIPVNGECDIRSRTLEVMVEGQSNWTSIDNIAASSPIINCRNKVFSFQLPSLKTMNKFDLSGNVTFDVSVKSLTVAGYSDASTLTIIYDPEVKIGAPPGFRLNSGGGFTTSANYKLKSQISFRSNQEIESARFKIRSGIRTE